MRDKVREFGCDPIGLQIQGIARIVKRSNGSIDLAATAAGVPPLIAVETLSSLVEAFRDVTR